MNILGISCYYHDSSAALIREGKVVVAVQEERFTRKKHDTSFPINSIEFCLKSQEISIDDIDYVVFYEKPVLKFDRFISQCIEGFPKTLKIFLKAIPLWYTEKLKIIAIIRKKLKYKRGVLFVPHHISHAANSFYPSPFCSAAIVTIDGVGEWTTTTYGEGKDNKISLMGEINFPHSLGLFYSTMTTCIGFNANGGESKLMALSAYGEKNKKNNQYYQKLKKVVKMNNDGSFSLDMDYFSYQYGDKMPSKKLHKLLSDSETKKRESIEKKHKDIASATQIIYEDAFFNILNHVKRRTKKDNLVLGGGCVMNSTANGKILKKTKFKNIWIPPDPGDGGTSVGAALYVYHVILGKKKRFIMENAYLGPKHKNKEIEHFLSENEIVCHKYKDKETLLKKVAKLLSEDMIVGWFQGKMEWGPRALGARSILSNPCNPKTRQRLLKIKEREKFRPLCPVVCREDATKYFNCDNPLPESTDFISLVQSIKKEWKQKIPAVIHKDGTVGLQTIREKDNSNYYNLIKEFGKLSGVSVITNTSFNMGGEPIVNTPSEAYRCMMVIGLDCLCIGNYLIFRKENKKID